MKILNENEYIYMDTTVRMSKNALYNIMYAGIITRSFFTNSYCFCYEYTRKQNAYNNTEIKVHIHPSQISLFEKESGCKLRKPITITVNNSNGK